MSGPPRWAWAGAGILAADIATKQWAVTELTDRDIDLFWTLRFHLSYNTGMAFGQGQAFGPVIGALALVVIAGLLLSLRRGSSPLGDLAVGLIVGGATGNLVDRLFRSPGWFRGAVIDFIDLQWFPIFNVADMAITIGGAMLVLVSWWAARHPTPEPADPG